MKVNADELEILRTFPQASQWYLGVERGVTLLEAQVDGDQAQGSTTILLKNVVVDDLSDLRQGMTVAIHLNINNDRKVSACFLSYDDGTLTLTVAPHAENLADDTYVTVFSARKLWKVDPPAWDGSHHILPFAIAGPDRAGFVNEPLKFIGANSYHPLGRTIAEYHWKKFDADLVSGDLDTAGTVDDPIVLSWATPSEYLVKLRTVDEDAESNASFRTVLMFPRTGEGAPYERYVFNNVSWSGTGWSADVTVYGTADADQFPPQAKVILWKEDYFGGVLENIGGPFRGLGECWITAYIRTGTTVVNAEEQSVSFTLDSTEKLMQRLEMPDFTFRDTSILSVGSLTPEALTTDVDDYSPTDFGTQGTLNLSATTAVNITGLTGGTDTRRLKLVNVGANDITLKHESGSSLPENQFSIGSDLVLGAGESVVLYYDGITFFWTLNDASETAANTFQDLTVCKALVWIIQKCTTLDSMCDVFTALLDHALDIVDVPSAALADQLQQSLLGTCFGYIGGSRFGSVTFAKHRNMMTADERGLFKRAAISFTPADWISLTIEEERFSSTSQIILEGSLGDGTPIRALFPTSGPGHNGSITRLSGFLFKDQVQADVLAHQMYKRDNRRVKRATLQLPNYAMLEPAFQDTFSIYLPSAFNTKGYDWTSTQNGVLGKEFHCVGMSFQVSDGYMLATIVGERSVFADDGDGWDVPEDTPVMEHVYGYDSNAGQTGTGSV